MSDSRRLRIRDQGSTKGPHQRTKKGVRSRLGSVSVSNEDSTDGEEDVTAVTCSRNVRKSPGVVTAKDNASERGLRPFIGRKTKLGTSLAERDVIDGFLILSFATYQDLESEVKESEEPFAVSESEAFTEPHQSDDANDSKDEEDALEKLEILLTDGKRAVDGGHRRRNDEAKDEKDEEIAKPRKIKLEVSTLEPPREAPLFTPSKNLPVITSQLSVKVVKVETEPRQKFICDTAEAEKKVPPDLEPNEPDTAKRDDPQTPGSKSPSSLKSAHFLPLQNGPVQQPEPSAAVAAVTVTASTVNPATAPSSTHPSNPPPLPSSTSPAGGVPFPSSLLSQEEFPTVATSTSKSPVLGHVSKTGSYEVKPYPSYSDYAVNYQYASGGGKHHYPLQESRTHHHQKSTHAYYPSQQQLVADKYHGTSKESRNSYENGGGKSTGSESDYCAGSSDNSNKQPCDQQQQYVYHKKVTTPSANSGYGGYKTNELHLNDSPGERKDKLDSAGVKVPNRTTYYQSIVNKTHSRHNKSGRSRVLPASAYENPSKQAVNSCYPVSTKQQPDGGQKYASQHHYVPSDTNKSDYYVPVTCGYGYSNHKSEHVNSWSDPSSYAGSTRNYSSSKVNQEHGVGAYRDKQTAGSAAYVPITKAYSNYYPTTKSGYVGKPDTSPYTNSSGECYQKGNVTYSRSGNQSHNNSTGDAVYKNSNHVSETAHHHPGSGKNGSAYQHHSARTLSEAKGRSNYYAQQEGNYNKTFHCDPVPKHQQPSAEDSSAHGYNNKVHHHGDGLNSSYASYNSGGGSLKPKEVSKPVSEVPGGKEAVPQPPSVTECHSSSSSSSQHPETSPYCHSSSKDGKNYYNQHYHHHQDHFVNRRTATPPPSKPQTSFESLKLPSSQKQDAVDGFRSTASLLSSYSQRASSPAYDNPSRSAVKTLWSPTATTPTVVTNGPSREIVTASSRDSHSSHSNSSISSLSQLSQSLGSGAAATTSKEPPSKDGRCSSRDETTPVSCTATTTTATPSSAAYGVSGSLTSLIFSKPSWTSPSSTSTVLSNPSNSHFTPPSGRVGGSPVPSVLPLAPSLPGSHHSSPFPAGPHVMFAPPLPTAAGSLSSPISTAPFAADSLLVPPNQDLLRRELDTRFLASQDRSINVPPPPYLRTEMHQHQHQHTHMHQHSPFLPPPMGGSLLPPSAAHLYDKFPKVDSSFYGRSALGLPAYPSISPLLAPGSATSTPTPFAPPGHVAAFQPKISPLVKAKTMKSGRWCAMHVRISWEIYHHQQKQQAEGGQKGSGKTAPDLLRPPNHLFGSLPRPHELGFSSPLLTSAASLHGRSPYDVSPQHPSFLGPSAAHLGITPFARPNYPGLGVPGNSFGGLGSLGLTGAGLLAAGRELGPGYLSLGDPWSRLHRTPPNFPSPSSSWGGLKAEAEARLLQQEKQMKKAEVDKRENDKAKEIKEREKREQEKQKERDRDNRVTHLSHSADSLRNGESSERSNNREWERRRDSSRSPIRQHGGKEPPPPVFESNQHHSSHHHSKTQGPPQLDVKVKEEVKKEEEQQQRNKDGSPGSSSSSSNSSGERPLERTKSNEPAHDPGTPIVNDYMSRSSMLPPHPVVGSAGAPQVPPPPHFWNPLPGSERYLGADRSEQLLLQKYASLQSSVMPLMPAERYREAELLNRHLQSSEAAAREVERQLQADRDRQAYERTKLPPPPLRPNDPPYVPPGIPPAGGLFNPFLNSLCGYPPRTGKPGSPGGTVGNGIPPPLIPCIGQGGSPVGTGGGNSTTPSPLHLKPPSSSSSSNPENSTGTQQHYSTKDRRELASSTEIESQSR